MFNEVSGDLASATNSTGGKGVVIATVFPKMTPKATGFFPLKVNLRNLLPGRKLMFWPSVAYFRGVVSGVVSVAGVRLADGEGDCYFLDEAGNKVDLVSGDASNMTVVPYLTAGGIYSDAFITVDATSSDKSALEKLAASSDPNNPDNPGSPTSNKGSGGCDAGFAGFLGLTLLSSVVWLRKR
ncbi:MAG: hypothetical protein IJR68_09385 [Fretibacterium sp.]|nr:hypothetical protein [Fretibacterium sp.]